MLSEKQGFLTRHQNACLAEPVSGSQRKEQLFSCRTGGAAVAGATHSGWQAFSEPHFSVRHPRRHCCSCCRAAARRLCCVRNSRLRPGPCLGTSKPSTKPSDAFSLRNVAGRKRQRQGFPRGPRPSVPAASLLPWHAQF